MILMKLAKANINERGSEHDASDICGCRRGKYDQKIGGKAETKKFLENLGFVAGATVTVISQIGGNVIVNVKESRVAVSEEMASKIMV